MSSNSKDLPIKDALHRLALRMEAVEKFISFKFGENAIGNINLVTTKKINRITQSKTKDYGAKRANTALKNILNRSKSYPLTESLRKRTRSSQRLRKSYKEEDSSNSGEDEEPKSFNFNDDEDDDDGNMLLIPKREIVDPECDLQNYYDENDDSMNSMNDLEESYENHSSDKESAEEEEDDESNLPWKTANYEPPVILSKGMNQHILVYNSYSYTLRTQPKKNSDGRVCPPETNERQVWRCNNIVSSRGLKKERCCMRIYTRGPEYKVVKVLGKHNHPPRTDKVVKHTVMYSMKKLAETTDQPILEIINNTLREADEKTKLALPKFASIRNMLRRYRQQATGKRPVRTTPCFDHIINKLKQGDTAELNSNKKTASKSKSVTRSSPLVSPGVTNEKSSTLLNEKAKCANQDNELEASPLLIPKTEVCCFDDNRDQDDGDTDVENGITDEYLPAEDNINAPFLQEGYEPPFLLEKGDTKRLLVYQGFTYALRASSKTSLDECSGVVIRERQENDKKIWRCSLNGMKTESKNSSNCLARIYTWGPELKVLGFLGEHSHPPRTEEIQKRLYMRKLREIAKTTDTPINDIIEDSLKDVPEEIKSILPQASSLKHYLRAARRKRKPHVKNTIKMYERIKHLKGIPDNTNASSDSTQKLGASTSHLNNSMLNNKPGEVGYTINDGDKCPTLDDDTIAPWMMPDYVAPLVLPSYVAGEDGIVLAFKGYMYFTDSKYKRDKGTAKEHGKRNWRCPCNNEEGEKCRARMYTWGEDYKVVGFWGQHNHPPREDKIEARLFMEKVKEMARTSDATLSEIVKSALADKSEQFKDTLPKLDSIYSVLRRARSKCGMYTKRVKTNSPKRPPRKKVKSKTNTEEFNLSDYFQLRY